MPDVRWSLTLVFAKELLELNAEEERLQDKGDDDGDYNHGEDVECHKEDSAPITVGRDGVALHGNMPVVYH